MVKTQFKSQVRTIRSDNTLELGSSTTGCSYFSSKGILHQTSYPYTLQQNGVVERKHRHLLETSRALLFYSHLLIKFWGDCILTATYLIIDSLLTYSLVKVFMSCCLVFYLDTLISGLLVAYVISHILSLRRISSFLDLSLVFLWVIPLLQRGINFIICLLRLVLFPVMLLFMSISFLSFILLIILLS